MTIKAGDRLPEATFKVMSDDGPMDMSTSDLFGGKRVVAFAVPGAFTPTCHGRHVPNFLDKLDVIKSKGVDDVICIAVNDVFVLNAWSKDTGGNGKITFVSDGNAEFTKAIGLDFDATAAGLGTRSQRYAMLVDDGVVKVLNVEEAPKTVDLASAEKLLESM